MSARPYRSVLYIPGSKERALEKAKTLPVDAIIFDLEDAVAVDEKTNARALLAETLRTADYGARRVSARMRCCCRRWTRLRTCRHWPNWPQVLRSGR